MQRRGFLILTAGALLLAPTAQAESPAPGLDDVRHSQVALGDVELHVAELGEGPAVLLVHGFPDVWRGWRPQMEALAAAGYHAVALDMRGYGRSSAPADPEAYTPFHTVGDLVGVLDALGVGTATVVGHDFGASVAWAAALMRPDRFTAVFGVSVPFTPIGETSFLDEVAASGATGFYMFDQMEPGAAALWSDAAVTYPGILHHSSGSPPPEERWDPFAGIEGMLRPAPPGAPAWMDPGDLAYAVAEFGRTGFQGGLNYYCSIEPYQDLAGAFRGKVVEQPSFFLVGELDALNQLAPPTEEGLRAGLPGLRGFVSLPGVGHWPNREATKAFNAALLGFLDGLPDGRGGAHTSSEPQEGSPP